MVGRIICVELNTFKVLGFVIQSQWFCILGGGIVVEIWLFLGFVLIVMDLVLLRTV